MQVQIKETNEIATLVIRDPKTRCEWTRDLLGNHGALDDRNADNIPVMSRSDYDWWSEYIDGQDEIQAALEELTAEQMDEYQDRRWDWGGEMEDEAAWHLALIAECKRVAS